MGSLGTTGYITAFAALTLYAGGCLPIMTQRLSVRGDTVPANGGQGAGGGGIAVFYGFTVGLAA